MLSDFWPYVHYIEQLTNPLRTSLYFLPTHAQAAQEIRQIDWTTNPLGPPERWPIALKTAVQMMLDSRFPKAIVWGPQYITLFNDAFRPMLGEKKECMGKPFNVIWAEVWTEIGPIVKRAYSGEATYIEDFPLAINRHGYPENCHFTFGYSPIRDEFGTVAGMMDTVMETTGKIEAQQQAGMLNAELAHRIKNIFTIVHAIASHTFRGNGHREDVRSFEQRILALSGAHDVLVTRNNVSDLLKPVIIKVANALGVQDRVSLEGPPIFLGPRTALSLSLLMHELMTNAVKYGSLSNDEGRVAVVWTIENTAGGKMLKMSWRERGGPPPQPPAKKGFGSKLINMGLSGAGGVSTSYTTDGFEADMTASLDQIQRAN